MLCVLPTGMGMVSGSPVTDNSKFESYITERLPVFNMDTSSTLTSADTSRVPNQPIQSTYIQQERLELKPSHKNSIPNGIRNIHG